MDSDSSKTPLYVQIRENLRREIEYGVLPAYSELPSEKELAGRFDVSLLTVRQAIADLASEGLVEKSKGRRSIICPPKEIEPIFVLTHGNEYYKRSKENVTYKLLHQDLISPPNSIREKLQLSWTVNEVIRISRIRLINDNPISAYIAYLDHSHCKPLLHENLENRSLVITMREQYQLIPHKILHQFEVVLAGKEISDLLQINEKIPVLIVESTEFTKSGIPYFHIIEYYRADRYKFQLLLTENETL